MKKTILPVVILFVLSGFAVGTETHNLQSFLSMVEQHNRDLQLAEKELDLAQTQKKEAWSRALPKISAQGSYTRNLGRRFLYIDFPDFETGETTQQKFQISYWNEFGFNLGVSQTLFSFDVGQGLKAAKQYETLTDYVYDAQYQTVMSFAKKAFFQTLLLKKVWEVSQASEENARENYELMKKKYENGVVSQLQLLQAEVRWKNIQPETIKAKRNYELVLNSLKTFAGIPEEEEIALEGNLDAFPSMPEEESLEGILEQRPDFNALLWEKALRETDVKARSAGYYPSLRANIALYNLSALSDRFKLDRKNITYWIGLSLNIPIWDGGQTAAQVSRARIELEKSRIKIEKSKEDILNELQNVYLRLKEADSRVAAGKQSVETAEKAFKVAESSARNGLATQLELKDARLLYDQAMLNYYSAVYDYLASYFDWELATGRVKR
jgi:outer membrane protein TolC